MKMAGEKNDDFFGFDELMVPFENEKLRADQSEKPERSDSSKTDQSESSSGIDEDQSNLTKIAYEKEAGLERPPPAMLDTLKYASLRAASKKLNMSFGDIRYDQDNRPLKHGQYDTEENVFPEYKKPKSLFSDLNRFKLADHDQSGKIVRNDDVIDDFDRILSKSRDSTSNKSFYAENRRWSRDDHDDNNRFRIKTDQVDFDQSDFDEISPPTPNSESPSLDGDEPIGVVESRDSSATPRTDHYRSIFESKMAKLDRTGFGAPREFVEAQRYVDRAFGPDEILNQYERDLADDHVTRDVSGDVIENFDQSENEAELSSGQSAKGDVEESVKARDFIDKLRRDKEKEKLKVLMEHDRDGSLLALKKIWSLIPDVNQMTKQELIDFLVKSVIFNENDLIAIDKPYGLATIGGTDVSFAVSHYLEDLRKVLAPQAKRLYLVHRLDKTTTGALMIATNVERLKQIKKLIAERKLTKRYWCITKSIPEPPKGVINIALGQCDMGHGFKLVPLPKRNEENQDIVRLHKRERFEAVTEYKVLSAGVKCALVETHILTGVKHQIRSHLGFGLNCPVLGDHKYSNYLKLLPQRLAPEVLLSLGIRATKSRHLPVYLHAKDIIIPEFFNGKNAFIRAPIPQFFLFTLKKLRLIAR